MSKRLRAERTIRGWVVKTLAASAILCAPTAFAATIGFNGYYDYATWTASTNISGPSTTVSTIDGTQQTLTLFEPDGADFGGPNMEGWFNFSHTVGSTGNVSFDWAFNWDIDSCCSGFNFYINSTLYNLADGYPGNPYFDNGGDLSGTFSAPVVAGDTITFQAFTADNCCEAANTVITNFDAGTGAPEPGSALLFGIGIAGILLGRRLNRRSLERSLPL